VDKTDVFIIEIRHPDGEVPDGADPDRARKEIAAALDELKAYAAKLRVEYIEVPPPEGKAGAYEALQWIVHNPLEALNAFLTIAETINTAADLAGYVRKKLKKGVQSPGIFLRIEEQEFQLPFTQEEFEAFKKQLTRK
jgi:hypothetical protein